VGCECCGFVPWHVICFSQCLVRSKDGFTLIELLVVIAVLGLLVATVISAYANYRNRACEAAATAYMRSWVPAQEVYLQVHGHYGDAGEQLAQGDLGINTVPTNIPYDFAIDSTSAETSSWWGSATPKRSGLRCFCITNVGVVESSLSSPAICN
jgi:prepilin-type N-terminal cleavage/methylation domain-containing protein